MSLVRVSSASRAFAAVFALLAASACAPGTPVPAQPALEARVKLDHFGYRPQDPKVAIWTGDPGPAVEVRTRTGDLVFRVPADGGKVVPRGVDAGSGDSVWWVDFSALASPGEYVLVSRSLRARSYPFVVAEDPYAEVLRAAARTFYYQRCGVPKSAKYAGVWSDDAACHLADRHARSASGGTSRGELDLAGGWHDAGDYNKYVWRDTATAVLFLSVAFRANPDAFPDGSLGIPESGNGWPDLLDELRWETDFLLRMQLPDGSVLARVQAPGAESGQAPPSADSVSRYYHDPTPESGAVLAGSSAAAAQAFAAAGDPAYAARLRAAALAAWDWLSDQPETPLTAWAAAEVVGLDPTVASARRRAEGFCAGLRPGTLPAGDVYAARAAIACLESGAARGAAAAGARAALGALVDDVFASDDLYRNGIPERAYHWGSNSIRAAQGVFLLDAARLGVSGSRTAGELRDHALDTLHYFHGQNPLGMVFLTNMAALGGEHSSWQIFHHWFGQAGNRHSRTWYVGKPFGVVEPEYPYFGETDNLGVHDTRFSRFGPPPGFVPGGPNKDYSGNAAPPAGARYPGRFYRDWNDQSTWTARTWEITENSIAYQAPYVALVSRFVGRAGPPEGSAPPARSRVDGHGAPALSLSPKQ